MEPSGIADLTLIGLALGGAFGAAVQYSHFCTMGCVSDAVLFGSFRRLRIWLLAIAVALLGSQALAMAGLVDLGASHYRTSGLFWLGALLGGIMFGFGMVLAGGCASRNLVRLGSGSLKALVTLLVMGLSAQATLTGLLAPVQDMLRRAGTVPLDRFGLADQSLASVLAGLSGLEPAMSALLLTLLIAGALLAFCLRDTNFRRARGDVGIALLLGALVPLGWLATAPLLVESLTFVAPAGRSLLYLANGAGAPPGYAVALVAGTILGAALVALRRGQFRLEGFVGRDDLVRHLVGGALMGCGGALAAGCTIGQGLTGVSTLALGSWLTLAAILAGGWWGVKYLETGRALPRLSSLLPRQDAGKAPAASTPRARS